MSGSTTRGTTGRLQDSPNRLVAAVFGVVYLLVGVLGFLYTGFEDFAGTDTNEKILGIFEVNPLHNIVHLGIGAVLLAASKTVASAKGANMFVGAVYLLVGIVGLFILDSDANILSLNGADNVLHLASALVLLGVALSQDKGTARGDVPGVPGV